MLAKQTPSALYYGAQVIGVLAFMIIVTFIAVWLDAPPSPWNAIWIMTPSLIIGFALNRGATRIVMAGLLFIAAWAVVGIVGTTVGEMWSGTSAFDRYRTFVDRSREGLLTPNS